MQELLLATQNPGKRREIQALLVGLPLKLVLPSELGISLEVLEDGSTYAENAIKKVKAFYSASHMAVLADDSGLEVNALDGAPGLHSARYSPQPGASDADRRKLLIANLEGIPRPWTAHFHCTVAISNADGLIQLAEGNCFGQIIPEERGSNGFGYDPIFLLDDIQKTMAELSMDEKNQLSHRAKAILAARPILAETFKLDL